MANALSHVVEALATLDRDIDRLRLIDNYRRGRQARPYSPDGADDEYRLLAARCTTNICEFIVKTPAQNLYVDSFRPSADTPATGGERSSPAMEFWQRGRCDGRQAILYNDAIGFGHAFVWVTRNDQGDATPKLLSPMRAVALYEDPVNDEAPSFAVYITKNPGLDPNTEPGEAKAWDDTHEYDVVFHTLTDEKKIRIVDSRPHGNTECPVERFAFSTDLEGRTRGVVEPMIPLQDRLNQTVFDLLMAQSFTSVQVRTVTGMAPPMQTRVVYETDNDGNVEVDESGKPIPIGAEPVIDPDTGRPVPRKIAHSSRRFLFAEDPEVKFGQLEGADLSGLISSINMTFQQIAALSQTPPHQLLGQIANLSAEALEAAEQALDRMVEEIRSIFGESWERVFRLAAELGGWDGAEDYMGEVVWRDMGGQKISQVSDALGKLSQNLGVPVEGLWPRVPGVTDNELATWKRLKDEQDAELQLAQARERRAGAQRPRLGSAEQQQGAAEAVT